MLRTQAIRTVQTAPRRHYATTTSSPHLLAQPAPNPMKPTKAVAAMFFLYTGLALAAGAGGYYYKTEKEYEAAKAKAREAYEASKDKAHDSYDAVKDRAKGAYETVRNVPSEARRQARKSTEHVYRDVRDNAERKAAELKEEADRTAAQAKQGWFSWWDGAKAKVFERDLEDLKKRGAQKVANAAEDVRDRAEKHA
ncbi:hypothetical protein BKA70DRAFT_1476315 [Coprinopsis sp. MPI-PUGE-AT-0042]|nr:hypothetical protein BKA70DRAFT_1476315 [Coprinopsis sp. MPI-PUGE-AT-0042]